MMRQFLAGLLLLAGWHAVARAVDAFPDNCKLELLASLPFSIDRGHIMVDVAVNGHPLRFMVDTGGVYSAISQPAATAIGLKPSFFGPAASVKDVGGAAAGGWTHIDTITFSHFKADGLRLLISALPPGEDGILGPDLLRNFDVELDFAGQRMNLFKSPRCDDHVVYWTDAFSKLSMRVTPQGHIQIPVVINGQMQEATLDTGAPRSLMEEKKAAQFGAREQPDAKPITVVGGAGGRETAATVTLESLVVGKYKWINPSVLRVPLGGPWRSEGSQLLLGLDVLHDTRLFIDYKGAQIFVSQR